MSKQKLPYRFKPSLLLVKLIKPNAKLIQLKLNETSVEKFENKILLKLRMDKENYVVDFEYIIKLCEVLTLSVSKESNQSGHLSFHCIKDH